MPTIRRPRSPSREVARWAVPIAAAVGLTWWAWSRSARDPLAAGLAAYERRAWDEAEAAARLRLKGRPDDREALRLLARALGRRGRDEEAQAIYRRRLGLQSMTAEDFVVAASGLSRRGQPGQARLALEKARAREPSHPEMLHDLARLDLAGDRLAEATELAGRLTTRPGWEARGWLLLGQCLGESGDPAGSAEALQRASRLDPAPAGPDVSGGVARKRIAREWLRAGRPAQARGHLEAVISRGPDPEASWLLGRALLQEGDVPAATAALARSAGYGDLDPSRPEPSPFAGAGRCAGCHRAIHDAQRSSRHARTFRQADELAGLPTPDRPVVDPGDPGARHVLRREGGRLLGETTEGGRTMRAVIDYAFGSGAVAVTMVGRDEAEGPCEFRLSHYGRDDAWDVTTGHLGRPVDPREYLGRPLGRDGVRRCLECHTTSARAARDRSGPASADRGIGCERCHGPGGNHLEAVEGRFPEPAIGRPRLATAERVMDLCAGCHSPKDLKLAPGDHLAPRFASPSLRWSRCYTESGVLSCVSCHDPHRDAETSPSYYEALCLDCHAQDSPAPPRAPGPPARRSLSLGRGRRVPCPVEPTGNCLGCHAPKVEGIVPHASFTDHHVRVRGKRAGGP